MWHRTQRASQKAQRALQVLSLLLPEARGRMDTARILDDMLQGAGAGGQGLQDMQVMHGREHVLLWGPGEGQFLMSEAPLCQWRPPFTRA